MISFARLTSLWSDRAAVAEAWRIPTTRHQFYLIVDQLVLEIPNDWASVVDELLEHKNDPSPTATRNTSGGYSSYSATVEEKKIKLHLRWFYCKAFLHNNISLRHKKARLFVLFDPKENYCCLFIHSHQFTDCLERVYCERSLLPGCNVEQVNRRRLIGESLITWSFINIIVGWCQPFTSRFETITPGFGRCNWLNPGREFCLEMFVFFCGGSKNEISSFSVHQIGSESINN